MRGNTMRLTAQRVASSSSKTEEHFIAGLLTTTGTHTYDQERDFRVFANNLEIHFRLVKAREGQQVFRRDVLATQGQCCAVCDIDIPVVLDAAHIVPKDRDGTDDPRNGLALCALHHRMFDADMFNIHPSSLHVEAAGAHSLRKLRISKKDIHNLPSKPHQDALQWRWDNLRQRKE